MYSRISYLLIVFIAAVMFSGCASSRKNISYDPDWGEVKRMDKAVSAVLIPVVDLRENTKTYPKQVIIHTDYSGNVSYDINDRAVDEVIQEAIVAELEKLGVKLIEVKGINGPVDKDSADRIRKRVAEDHPDAKVAFGANIKDFIATSQRTMFANNVKVSASLEFYVMDMETGTLAWSDYKTEFEDTVATAEHNYMIAQLNKALVNLMQKSIRDNDALKETLLKASKR